MGVLRSTNAEIHHPGECALAPQGLTGMWHGRRVRELLWPTGNNGPMLSPMNRLLRLLTLGGLLASSSLTSLTACAEATPAPPRSAASAAPGAAAPTTSQATPQDTTSNEA